MPTFEQFVHRHGETGAQALLENIERHVGLRTRLGMPLETRWSELIAGACRAPEMAVS
jgi:hypothetical protein